MPLTSGVRLGAYEIVAPLGAGGMGEVYRARDTRLDRTVALKILPERFAERSDLRERFEREARMVSNLNHPNICTLYDVGREGETAYFVMEYLDGQPLSDRLAKGPLPVEQAIAYAIDIADALAKAHRHGIVHRDLKPGNIMLTKSGAKLLDFGLARRFDSQPLLMPDAPTMQAGSPLTSEGMILGTLQYMSPEQLEGGEIDARSDIFALGAVLYEMVTGQRAFTAASHASLITKIMSEAPRPVRELAPVTPPSLETIIHRCLAKDPDARWQCAGDLVAELRAAPHAEAAVARRAKPWAWIAAATAAAVLAAILGLIAFRRAPDSQDVIRFTINFPVTNTSVVFNPLYSQFAVSPDGSQIVFVATRDARRHLWVRRLESTDTRMLEGTADAIAPFWSPDSKSIGFFANGKLLAIALDSAVTRTICNVAPGGAFAGAWSSQGTIVFTELATDKAVYAVPASGGEAKTLFAVKELLGMHYPVFLSDGRTFLFTGIDATTPNLWVGSIDGKMPPKRIAREIAHINYIAPYVVYARDGAVVAQTFDEDALQLTGSAVPIAPNVQVYWPIGASAHAAGGRLLVTLPNDEGAKLVWIDRQGRERDAVDVREDFVHLRISPDGRKVATVIIDPRTGIGALWMIDVGRKTISRFSVNTMDHERPVWSPDGKTLVFACDVEGPPHLFMQSVGGMKPQQLLPPGNMQQPREWISGDRIFYAENTSTTRSDIFIVSPSDKKPHEWLSTPFNEWDPRVSPDGKWVAFSSDQTGNPELYVAPIAEPLNAIRLTNAGGRSPLWSRNGREIFFHRQPGDVYSVSFAAEADTADAKEPVLLFRVNGQILDYDIAGDGAFLVARSDGPPRQTLNAVFNWQRIVEAN